MKSTWLSFKNVDWKSVLHYAIFMAITFFFGHITDISSWLVHHGMDQSIVDYGLAFV